LRFNATMPALLVACFIGGCGESCLTQGACIEPEHVSLDPTPLRIDLTSPKADEVGRVVGKLRIPRSYVVLAANHGSRKGALPEHVFTPHIEIRFVEGGDAWNIAVDRKAKSVGRAMAEKSLRPEEYRVSLRANANPNVRTDRQASIAGYGRFRQPDRYDGLAHFSGSDETFIGEASDAFESIRCHEHAHQSMFCTYEIDIGDTVSLSAMFLDFRLHGGRAYANQRAGFVREVVCRFTDCEADEARRRRLAERPFIGDQKRNVCIAREISQKIVTAGRRRLLVPAYFSTQDTWRPETGQSLSGSVLFPEMVPAAPIEAELRRAWLTVPVGDEERPAFSTFPTDVPCLAYAKLSLEDLAQRTLHLRLRSPADDPQTAESVPALECRRPGASEHFCFMQVRRDGWHVDISFGSKWRSKAESIRERVSSYLDRIALSQDPAPVVPSTPPRN
jgi:hypothetical protein